jgi:hypothetical protein
VPPKNFYGRAKINAKFGQNIKISEKFSDMTGKIFVMFVEEYLLCTENFFWYVRKKNFGDPPPPQQFLGEILMFSLPVRANYTVPPPQTRLGPYAHDNI